MARARKFGATALDCFVAALPTRKHGLLPAPLGLTGGVKYPQVSHLAQEEGQSYGAAAAVSLVAGQLIDQCETRNHDRTRFTL
jgi:hypothetical protein